MMRTLVAHVRAAELLPEGGTHAVTLFNRGKYGILVWAGILKPEAIDVVGDEVSPAHYFRRETVSFMSWGDFLEYYRKTPYGDLAERLSSEVKHRDMPPIDLP